VSYKKYISGGIAHLLGKVFSNVVQDSDIITFTEETGKKYYLMHQQDCCECVDIEDVVGDLSDLIGNPILVAEESRSGEPCGKEVSEYESCTWSFYKLATIKGHVDIRFFGTSNGYYSETADLYEDYTQ